MKPAAARAYIRQLCCLGPGAPAIVPDLLKALGAVIPSGPNVFVAVTPDFKVLSACLEDPVPALLDLYAQERYGAFRREIEAHSDWWRRHPRPTCRDARQMSPDIYRSDLYHCLWRPMGQHHRLEALISEWGQPLGTIELFRAVGESPFEERDETELTRLLPYIAHGLTTRPTEAPDFVDSGRSGHIVLDGAGRISHQSETARKLLYLATDPQFASSSPPDLPLSALLRKLAGDLCALTRGREAPPPVARRQNPWGRFVFRAYRLDPTAADQSMLTLVAIEYQEPLRLRLLRGLGQSPLSVREREVCFWLVQGLSQAEVAQRLHIQPGTAKKYADAAYLKLGVHARAELVERIMDEPGQTRPA